VGGDRDLEVVRSKHRDRSASIGENLAMREKLFLTVARCRVEERAEISRFRLADAQRSSNNNGSVAFTYLKTRN
jgi:hypothetical protein